MKTLVVNECEVVSPSDVLTGAGLLELAAASGIHIPEMPMLIEDMPNGSANRIDLQWEIKLRDWMQFVIISGRDNA
jgi:hypothetical protein